ncbi:hypothetical protein R70723_13940 [Paenibacillus sp. FSL R7-0273]|nr:hypothetical protein R70723_13940 [Paenibacillus sp. FSL R7-0273]
MGMGTFSFLCAVNIKMKYNQYNFVGERNPIPGAPAGTGLAVETQSLLYYGKYLERTEAE